MALVEAIAALDEVVTSLDPRVLSGEDAGRLAEVLAGHEKRCAALRLRAAQRAAECGTHRDRGHVSPASWMGRHLGTSTAKANADLELMAALDDHAATREALERGELSLDQAREIVKTLDADPTSEHEMLDAAKRKTLRQLKEKGRSIRARSEDAEARWNRQWSQRSLRTGVDDEGMEWVTARGPVGSLTAVIAKLRRQTDREFRQAYRAGRREPSEAYAFDAFVKLVNGDVAEQGGSRVDVTVLIDWPALLRGHLHDGERCKIPGVGDVPVSFVQHLLDGGNAFLKAVLFDGVDVTKVAHFGRSPSEAVLTALRLGPGPEFNGVECSGEHCDRRHGIEWDHTHPYIAGGVTNSSNLRPTCRPEHTAKTEADRRAGLLTPSPHPPPDP